ncbi:MAG: pentapeptide repeat-containing protein, partial [Chloroflexota bacterium]
VGIVIYMAVEGLTDTNIFTQIISVITIIMILDWRMQQRHENMQYQQNIQYVLRDLGNSDAISGMRGAREARAMGLLTDQSLEGADLQYANLAGADLSYAHLQRANLASADMTGTRLWGADLSIADFSDAVMPGTDLTNANLASAGFWGCDLRGANLSGACLHTANLDEAQFDENTVLPDAKPVQRSADGATIYDRYWTPATDMTRYTDMDHAEFWEPVWAEEGYDSFHAWDRSRYLVSTPPKSS